MTKRPSLEERRWFQSLFGVAQLLMAGGFAWAVIDGWNAMSPIINGVFVAACCVSTVCAVALLWERARRRSMT